MQTIEDQINIIRKKIDDLKEKTSEITYELIDLQNQLQALLQQKTFPKREKVLL